MENPNPSLLRPDPFLFRAGIMLLIAAGICYVFGTKESYANFGTALLGLYSIQAILERLILNRSKKPANPL